MLFTLKFSFYYLFNVIYNFTLFITINMLIFKISFLISMNIFEISFISKIDLHFVFKNFYIFFINVDIIMLILFLSINVIIFF